MTRSFTFVEAFISIVITGLIVMFIITGCHLYHASKITEGTVVWKKFVPEHEESETTYVYMYDDDGFGIPVTTYHTVPDSYTIGLEGQYKGKSYTRHVAVDRTSYMLIEEGQHLKISDLPLTPTAEREYNE